MSFGMIFSIILIIAFIAFAIYGIQKFLFFQQELKYRGFVEDFQLDVDKVWKSSQSSAEVTYNLPTKILGVCFVYECTSLDYSCYSETDNLIFESNKRKFDSTFISHIDLTFTIGSEKRHCFENVDGKVSMLLKKSYGDSSVTVEEIQNE